MIMSKVMKSTIYSLENILRKDPEVTDSPKLTFIWVCCPVSLFVSVTTLSLKFSLIEFGTKNLSRFLSPSLV